MEQQKEELRIKIPNEKKLESLCQYFSQQDQDVYRQFRLILLDMNSLRMTIDLNLRGNQLTSQGVSTFFQQIQNTQSVQKLGINLSYNFIDEQSVLAIMEFINRQSLLQKLDLSFEQTEVKKGPYILKFVDFPHVFTKYRVEFGQSVINFEDHDDNTYTSKDLYNKFEGMISQFYKVFLLQKLYKIYVMNEEAQKILENYDLSVYQLVYDLNIDNDISSLTTLYK
ncbi:hypothetical protein PPERSA_01210 [Pseudocohnilembus persalinus]|uniref:Uncharacterized protein n=1 Tax=Pseudocohnilembus persalinus TaxID=266149 RepID=A0A0V0R959_PSEPJ|nr:hypothetical protein PPERSA_01210 [Pseudocohnilembus persalinus]|eukprot:KRX11011.1 hypothetical protein PPERSA_01210 [Pseudocohnilembus persalinus]